MKFLIAFLFLCGTVLGQQYSVCKVENDASGMQGSAVMVYKHKSFDDHYLGLAATAVHVVSVPTAEFTNGVISLTDKMDQKPKLTVIYYNGKIVKKAFAAAWDTEHDLALIWTTCPNNIPIVDMHDNSILTNMTDFYKPCDRIKTSFYGYGAGEFNVNAGYFSFVNKGWLTSDSIITPGQSGGGMFIDDKLAGIICYGDQKFNEKTVWPAHCANANLIPGLIKRALMHPPK